MEFFRIKKDIPFMKHALVFNAVSFVTFALAVFFLFTRGLHLSVEFTGGTLMEVAYSQAADLGKVRSTVAGLGFAETQVQNFGTARDVMIRLPLRADDYGSTVYAATPFPGSGSSIDGVIERAGDADVFAFTASAGSFSATRRSTRRRIMAMDPMCA